MFNDHLSSEEARELIAQRVKEVETYSLQKRLGYGDNSVSRWVLVLVILIIAAAVGLLL